MGRLWAAASAARMRRRSIARSSKNGWMSLLLFWGGLRGSPSIALALSLPLSLPYHTELTMLVFCAVVFSLLAQGLTVAPLLKWLRLTEREPESLEYEVLQGRLLAETAALAELDSLRQRGLITARVCDDLKAELTTTQQTLSEQLAGLGGAHRAVEQQQAERIRHRLVSVKKTRLGELLHDGILSEQSHSEGGKIGRAHV